MDHKAAGAASEVEGGRRALPEQEDKNRRWAAMAMAVGMGVGSLFMLAGALIQLARLLGWTK